MFEDEMDTKIYKLYITQIKEDQEENLRFIERLEGAYDFQWENYSLPGEESLEDIKNHINQAEVVILLSGLYSLYPDYLQQVVDISHSLNKPIVIIRPYGVENIPLELEEKAQEVVGWNSPCIVDAIKGVLGLGEGVCSI